MPSTTVRPAKSTTGRFPPSENFSSISAGLASNGLTDWFAAKETPVSVSLLLPLRRRTLNLHLQTRLETKISGGIEMKKLLFRSLLLVVAIASCSVLAAAGPKGRDLRADRRDIRHDTRDIRHDRRDINQD